MKRLTYIVVILALVYSGYWVVGAATVEDGAKTQLETMTNDGWDVTYNELATRGFPSRFDTTVTDFGIAPPDRRWRYDAEMVQALALSYQPTSVILALPAVQTVTIADQPYEILSDALRASVSLAANTALSLKTITAEANSAALVVTPETRITATDFLAALRENSRLPYSYDAYFTLNEIAVPAAILAGFAPQNALPQMLDTVTVDGTVTLDRPIDRHSLAKWDTDPGQLRGVTLRALLINWGAFEITGNGAFTVDPNGTPDGMITVTVQDWEGMLDAAIATGLVPDQFQFAARSIGQTLSYGAQTLELPIAVRNGNLSVGPFPLGLAPKFN